MLVLKIHRHDPLIVMINGKVMTISTDVDATLAIDAPREFQCVRKRVLEKEYKRISESKAAQRGE